MRISVEFTFEILEDRKIEYQRDGKILSDEIWLSDSMDFEYDVFDGFIENWKELEKAETGLYHVFQYGTVSAETSYTEYGPEFDRWLFDVDFEDVKRLEFIKE